MSHLLDTTASMNVEEAANSMDFQQCSSSVPLFGLGKNAHWLKFNVANRTQQPDLVLSIPYPGIPTLLTFGSRLVYQSCLVC